MWTADLGNGRYRNPILYADYSDPDCIRVGEDYYMISSSFSNAPALPLLHSKDLVNWKVVNYVLDNIPEFRYRNPIHGCGVWAPSIRYHEGTFYVCFPMPDEGIYMTTTKDPLGKWSKPVNIRPGAGWIDPCPFWDEDGKAYLVAGVAKSRIGYKSVLHMVEMSPDGLSLIGKEVTVFDGNENDQVTIEGPKMYKRNGWYYIFAPAGGVKTGWQTVLRSKNIYGPYEYKVVMRQGESSVNGPHQGAWVDTVTGQDWFIHFQDVYAAGRIVHLQPMIWKEDWPIIGVNKDNNDYGEPVMEYEKPDVGEYKGTVYCPDCSDEFSGKELGKQWQWNANWSSDWFEMMDGGLKLNAVGTTKYRKYGDIRNILLQKWPAPEFSCVTKIDLSGMEENETAGYISLGRIYTGVVIIKVNGSYEMKSVRGEQTFDCDTAFSRESVDLVTQINDCDSIFVRYTVKRVGTTSGIEGGMKVDEVPIEETSLEVSTNGVDYVSVIKEKAIAGRWVGMKSGPFIKYNMEDANESKHGYIVVNYTRYSN